MLLRYPKEKAFTLTEVLLALLILAVAMIALQLRMSQYLADSTYLRRVTIANWVALNQLELLRISNRSGVAPPVTSISGSVIMAETTWYWYLTPEITLNSTSETSLVPVRVQVSDVDISAALNAPLVTLRGVADAAFHL